METNASDRIGTNGGSSGVDKADDAAAPVLEPFEPPVFGITFIGTSHGFDAKGSSSIALSSNHTHTLRENDLQDSLYASGRTTGFIIWLNGYGVLVDPPMQTTEFLRRHVRTEAHLPPSFPPLRVVSRPNHFRESTIAS